MLPGELLRVSVRGGLVRPRFTKREGEVLAQAEAVREAFVAGAAAHRRVGEVQDELEELAVACPDPKLFRGLVKVARDRCTIEADPAFDPPALRLEVFRRAAGRAPLALAEAGRALERPTARDVLAELAAERGTTVEQLEAALYADLPTERRLVSVDLPDAAWLLDRYDVALVQGVLLGAVRIELSLRDPSVPRMRQLFRWVKFHQLLHRAERGDEGLRVVLDGPVSLFSASTRYGLQLARFFPALLLQDGAWELVATVRWGRAGGRKELRLTSDDGLRSHYEDHGVWRPKAVDHFVTRFDVPGWSLTEASAPLRSRRGTMMFPDFSLRSGEATVHVEVLGWWREDSLGERLRELDAHGPRDLLLAVSRKLRAGPGGDPPEHPRVVSFADALPVRLVVAAAERVLAERA